MELSQTIGIALSYCRWNAPGKRIVVHLAGVDSAAYVWLNGVLLGYMQDRRAGDMRIETVYCSSEATSCHSDHKYVLPHLFPFASAASRPSSTQALQRCQARIS